MSQFDMFKGQTADKLQDMKEVLDGEKATCKSWRERAENYSRENVVMQSRVMESEAKTANLEMTVGTLRAKLEAANDDIHDLTRERARNRGEIEELKRMREDLDRDLTAQREVMAQKEVSKGDLVSKLQFELDTVEARFKRVINENLMVGEDYRMRALLNYESW